MRTRKRALSASKLLLSILTMGLILFAYLRLRRDGPTIESPNGKESFNERPDIFPVSKLAQKEEPSGYAISEDIVKKKIETMTRKGADGSVAFHVRDEIGKPIHRATLRLYFSQAREDDSAGRVEGITDWNGFFTATKRTNWSCTWVVSKEGYHSSRGTVLFTHQGNRKAFLEDRWTDTPIEVPVTLKERSDATIIHGKRLSIPGTIQFPTNTWVGFDFSVCDLVEPLGTGKTSHMFFRSETDGVSPFESGATPGYTNILHLKIGTGGLAVFKTAGESDSPFLSETPATFDTNVLAFVRARTKDEILVDTWLKGKSEYIAFRTELEHEGQFTCFSGIIRNLRFSPGGLQLEYFFNTTSGDPRIDADVSSPVDFGK